MGAIAPIFLYVAGRLYGLHIGLIDAIIKVDTARQKSEKCGYISKGTFEGSLEVQRQLIADYKEDIRKYAEGIDQTKIVNVFNHIPVQLAKDNKKFQISKAP